MSTEKKEISVAPAVELPVTSYHEAAQALVEQLRRLRETIPHFTMPTVKGGRAKLNNLASVSPEFIEVASVARINHTALRRGEGWDPAVSRDLMSYADAYAPVAAEFEAIGQFVRFSVDAAKSKVAFDALTTYALAQRLARRPEHADLVPTVADMQRTLGIRFKRLKSALARKQQQAAASSNEK